MIRIKRKSVECVSDNEDDALEKRPKVNGVVSYPVVAYKGYQFKHKEWVLPAQQRRNILRIPPTRI